MKLRLSFSGVRTLSIALFCLSVSCGFAGTHTIPGTNITLNFSINSDGNTVTVTGCNEDATGELVIPETISGKTVSELGSYAFEFCEQLTSVSIPDTVTSIPNGAFCYCTGLLSFDTGNGATTIGYWALDGCTNLSNLTLGEEITTILDWAFSGCDNLTQVTIPAKVSSIGYQAFNSCDRLAKATFEGDAPTISEGVAFAEASADFYVEYYEGANGFSTPEWEGFPSQRLPTQTPAYTIILHPGEHGSIGEANNGPDFIAEYREGTAFPSIHLYPSWSHAHVGWNTENGWIATLPSTVTADLEATAAYVHGALHYSERTSDVVITDCDYGVFGHVAIPDTIKGKLVTEIGNEAFINCPWLSSITLGKHVRTIGTSAFAKCTDLTHVLFPEGLIAIGHSAFWRCTALRSATLPASVTTLYDYAFYECTQMENITFQGDAPASFGGEVFGVTAAGFTVQYYQEAIGFTSPTWEGYNSVILPPRDDDNDGWSNTMENLLGTNSADAGSHFRVWCSRDYGIPCIHYAPHSESCTFLIETTSTLDDPESWAPVSNLVFSGDAGEKVAELPTAASALYYRISISKAE